MNVEEVLRMAESQTLFHHRRNDILLAILICELRNLREELAEERKQRDGLRLPGMIP